MIELWSRVGTLNILNRLYIFRYRKVLLRPESNSIKSKSTSILLDLMLSKSGKTGADFIEGRAYWAGLINIRIISYQGNKEKILTNLINFSHMSFPSFHFSFPSTLCLSLSLVVSQSLYSPFFHISVYSFLSYGHACTSHFFFFL